jgi:glycine/D-amino acid oxidase-like deaminating enzyme
MESEFETLVIGGGLVGASVAMGIASKGHSVAVLDGGDADFRASRGNFGLTWVQGKGAHNSAYAQLNILGAGLWPAFSEELEEATGIPVGYRKPGGLDFCLSEEEWVTRSEEMRLVSQHTNGEFTYEMLGHADLKKRVPLISDSVLGASYSPHDGHLNPLYLLRALHQNMISLGCRYLPNQKVGSITRNQDGFTLHTEDRQHFANRIVLCCGLDNTRLAQQVGMHIPIEPVRGQLLITERVAPFLNMPSLQVRQTCEGTLQIGDSHEHADLDDGTSLNVITKIASRAVQIFPHLKNVHLNRAWGALRIMTPDGLPVYHQSEQYPGAFAVTCHSGVTLSVVHAGILADWICGGNPHHLIHAFSADRFHV